jgi:hypothetical protein
MVARVRSVRNVIGVRLVSPLVAPVLEGRWDEQTSLRYSPARFARHSISALTMPSSWSLIEKSPPEVGNTRSVGDSPRRPQNVGLAMVDRFAISAPNE